jgi:hypothetical protein
MRPAAEENGGGGAPVVVSGEEGVGKLQGGVGKLGVGPIGVEEGRKGCFMASRGWRRAVVDGGGAPAGIRWRLEAGEHEQRLGKFARGLVGTMGGRWRLPAVARSSLEGRSRAAVVIGLRVRTARGKEMEMGRVLSTGTAEHKREGKEVDAGVEYGGDDVAAGGGSGGHGAREIGLQGRARAAADVHATRGEGGSRRWSGSCLHSGGGEVLYTSGSEEQGTEGCQRKKKGGGGPKGLCGNIKNLRDPTVK